MTIVQHFIAGTAVSIIDEWDMTNVTPGNVHLYVERFGQRLFARDEGPRAFADILNDIRDEMIKRGCHDFGRLTPRGGECRINGVHVSFVGGWQGIRLDLILRALQAAPLDESPFYTMHKARFAEQYNDDLTKLKPEYANACPTHRDA